MKIIFFNIICVLISAIKVSSQAGESVCINCNVGGVRGTFHSQRSPISFQPLSESGAPFVPQPIPYNTYYRPEDQPYFYDPSYL